MMGALVGAMLALATPAHAIDTGNELYDRCTGSTIGQSYCTGYLDAIAEAMGRAGAKGECVVTIPEKVVLMQLLNAVVKYLSEHPESHDADHTDAMPAEVGEPPLAQMAVHSGIRRSMEKLTSRLND
jgi:Ssp1 endopeptidase immunity protein Rap1a